MNHFLLRRRVFRLVKFNALVNAFLFLLSLSVFKLLLTVLTDLRDSSLSALN